MKDALDLVIPDELNNLSILVEKSPERLASGSEDLRLAALQAAKYVFDMGASVKAVYWLVLTMRVNSTAVRSAVDPSHNGSPCFTQPFSGTSNAVAGQAEAQPGAGASALAAHAAVNPAQCALCGRHGR